MAVYAVRLVGEHYQAGGAAVAANGFVEHRGLQGSGAGVGVLGAVHDENRRLQFVGVEERGDFQVHVGGFPNAATLVLETEGRERFVVGAASGDTGAEEIGMSDEIHGHQGAVAVTGDTDAVGVDHTEAHAFIDSGLGIGDELLEVGVVGFLGITDDRERSVVDDGITGEQEKAILRKRVKVFWEPTTWPATEAWA